MNPDLIITVLAMGFFASTAAFFVMWSKYEEQKQKTAEEHTAYRNALEYGNAIAEAWRAEHSNYMAALQIGKTNAEYAQRLQTELEHAALREKCQAQSVLWYADQLKYWKQANDDKTRSIQFCHAEYAKLRDERDALQDFKSSKLCPHNDHIWIDGRCKRCGRESPLPDLYVITDYGASGDPGPRGVED